ncbi:MAG: hypothetical protein H7061_00285 [Bdellovibrionaceae bacterium]|nr:hypothetical protein [Bdellovibrio sp.]
MNLVPIYFGIAIILTACPKRPRPEVVSPKADTAPMAFQISSADLTKAVKKPVGSLSKEQREGLYFAASLEREALRLITKSDSYQKGTLFSILSAAFENEAGAKKIVPENAGCSRMQIQNLNSRIQVLKTCQSKPILISEVELKNAEHLAVSFKVREWGSVIGTSVALTNSDVTCNLTIQNKKLESMDCQNWAYIVTENNLSATEIKLKTFHFERKSDLQFELKGGFYKDLIENKKIAIMVPLQGKIKLIEKEIEVIDDFASVVNPPVALPVTAPITSPAKPATILIGGPHGQKENSEKSSVESNQPEGERQEIESQTENGEDYGGVPRNGVPQIPHRGR